MDIYINGIGCVSPQLISNEEDFLSKISIPEGPYFKCLEPDYTEYFTAMQRRRMSKMLKMGVYAAKQSLAEAGLENVDAIITGTGMGMFTDTEKFLTALIENKEELLTPTSFIQSTHNTLGALIALMIKCYGYNYTYAHKTFSFETSLIDGIIQLNNYSNILVACADEVTEKLYKIRDNNNHWKKGDFKPQEILNDKSEGTYFGEGAASFVLAKNKTNNSYCKLSTCDIFFNEEPQQKIEKILAEQNMILSDIDCVLYGINGDSRYDESYYMLSNGMLNNATPCYYKHLVGDFHTSTGFAMWLASNMIKYNRIPETIRINNSGEKDIRNVLIYNQERSISHSIILLSKC